jgi:hypothetical protein
MAPTGIPLKNGWRVASRAEMDAAESKFPRLLARHLGIDPRPCPCDQCRAAAWGQSCDSLILGVTDATR